MHNRYDVLKFRSVMRSDVSQLQQLHKECFPVSWFYDLVNNTSLISIVAVINDTLIGILVGKIMLSGECNEKDKYLLDSSFSPKTSVAYLLSLGVKFSYRSKGIASLLLSLFLGYVSGTVFINKANNCIQFQNRNELTKITESPDNLFTLSYENTDYESLIQLLGELKPVLFSVKVVYLHVLSTNTKAREFYENRGFKYLYACPNCYSINNEFTDGCTYALYINDGFGQDGILLYKIFENVSMMLSHTPLVSQVYWLALKLNYYTLFILNKLYSLLKNILTQNNF